MIQEDDHLKAQQKNLADDSQPRRTESEPFVSSSAILLSCTLVRNNAWTCIHNLSWLIINHSRTQWINCNALIYALMLQRFLKPSNPQTIAILGRDPLAVVPYHDMGSQPSQPDADPGLVCLKWTFGAANWQWIHMKSSLGIVFISFYQCCFGIRHVISSYFINIRRYRFSKDHFTVRFC